MSDRLCGDLRIGVLSIPCRLSFGGAVSYIVRMYLGVSNASSLPSFPSWEHNVHQMHRLLGPFLFCLGHNPRQIVSGLVKAFDVWNGRNPVCIGQN